LEIQVQISQDYRSAFINVFVEENKKDVVVSVPRLEKALSDAGVIVGIKMEVLKDICENKRFNQKTSIAECIEPETGDDARVEIIKKPKKADEIQPVKKENGEIDFYAPRDGFITYARKGETLAIKHPPTRGEPGTSVLGRSLPGKLGKDIALDLFMGVNTEIKEDKLIAITDGIITLNALQVNIEKTYKINDHIGRNTGSIDLPKDLDITLIVDGDIQRGFSIKCNILNITGAIEDAEIDCNFLKVKGGIVGVGDKPINAESISVGYINGERKVLARIINVLREISSGAKVIGEVVKAYTIQGATVVSKEAIWTDYINGKNTVMVGIDYKAKTEFDELTRKIAEIREPLEELRNASYASAKRMKQLKELSKLNPNHPIIQKELPKIMEIKEKLEKFELMNDNLNKKKEENEKRIYSDGEPFLLVRTGFSKDTSAGIPVEPDTNISLKEYSTKVYEYSKGGLYYLSEKYGITSTIRYNIKEVKDKFEKLTEFIEKEINDKIEQSKPA
jgi:uncharacterized protein (DUF342 family)